MDDVARSGRVLLKATIVLCLVIAGLAGCKPRPSGSPAGASPPEPSSAGASARSDGGATAANAIPIDFRTAGFEKINRARFISNGHAAGRWDVDVYVSVGAKDVFLAERGDVPVGTRLVKEHFEKSPSDAGEAAARGPIMMMEKRTPGFDPEHGDWRYVVIGQSGDLVKDGPVASCAGCHDDAPHDHMFRIAE